MKKTIVLLLFLSVSALSGIAGDASAATVDKWSRNASALWASMPEKSAGRLYHFLNSSISAINVNGEQVWTVNATPGGYFQRTIAMDSSGTTPLGGPLDRISDNFVYGVTEYPSDSGRVDVSALNRTTGSESWTFTVAEPPLTGTASRAGDTYLVFGSPESNLTKINQNGDRLWSVNASRFGAVACGPATTEAGIHVASSPAPGDGVLVLYSDSGQELWNRTLGGNYTLRMVPGPAGGIIVASQDGVPGSASTTTIASYAPNGTLNWVYEDTAQYPPFNNAGRLFDLDVNSGGTVYYGVNTNPGGANNVPFVVALDGFDGDLLWTFNGTDAVENPVFTSLQTRAHKVYVTSTLQTAEAGRVLVLVGGGQVLWNASSGGEYPVAAVPGEDDTLYLVGMDVPISSALPTTPATVSLRAVLPPRAYVSGDIAPYSAPDARMTALDALVALHCAIGNLATTPEILSNGDVAPLDNSTGVPQPHPDGVLNVGDAVVLLKGCVGQYSWEGMALMFGQHYEVSIVTDTADLSRVSGYRLDLLMGDGSVDPSGEIGGATGGLPPGSSLEAHYDSASRLLRLGLISSQSLSGSLPPVPEFGKGKYLLLNFIIPKEVVSGSTNKISIVNDDDPSNGFIDHLGAKIADEPVGRMLFVTNKND